MPDDENDLIESGIYRIVDAVVNDKMSIVINWCKLFYASTKPGTDARCEDYEGFVGHSMMPFFISTIQQPFLVLPQSPGPCHNTYTRQGDRQR